MISNNNEILVELFNSHKNNFSSKDHWTDALIENPTPLTGFIDLLEEKMDESCLDLLDLNDILENVFESNEVLLLMSGD